MNITGFLSDQDNSVWLSRKSFWKWTLPLFLVINLALHVISLWSEGIFGDDAFSLFYSQRSLDELISVLKTDRNPPLYFIILHFWIKIFGIEPSFHAKFLSAIFSTGTLAMIFLLANRIIGRKAAITASLLFIISDLNTFFSHELRSWALVALLCTVSFYFYLLLIQKKKGGYVLALAICNALLLYSHYIALFIPVVQFFGSLMYLKGNRKIFFLLLVSHAVTLGLYAPWIGTVISNIPEEGNFWLTIPDYGDLIWVLHKLSFSRQALIVFTVLFSVFIVLFVLDRKNRLISEKLSPGLLVLFLLWFLLPVFGDYAVAKFTPVFRLRYVLYASIGLYLVIGTVLEYLKTGWVITTLLMVLVLYHPIRTFEPFPAEPEPWKEVVPEVVNIKDDSTAVIISAGYKYREFTYYYNIDWFRDYKHTYGRLDSANIYCMNDESGLNNIDYGSFDRILFIRSHHQVVDPENKIGLGIMRHGYRICRKYLNMDIYIKNDISCFPEHIRTLETDTCQGWRYEIRSGAAMGDTFLLATNNAEPHEGCSRHFLYSDRFSLSGNHSCLTDREHKFGITLNYPLRKGGIFSDLLGKAGILTQVRNGSLMVISIELPDKVLFRKEYPIMDQIEPNGEWHELFFGASFPRFKEKGAILKVYLWNPDGIPTYIDDLEIALTIRDPHQILPD